MLESLLAILAAYVIGSLPFGYITARLVAGIDIRRQGSGNIGATNVARVVGAKWGAAVLALDCLKGLLPVLLLPQWVAWQTGDLSQQHLTVVCAVLTILGHMFPCWLGFRGGKGVATACGSILVLSPWATLAALTVFAFSFWASRIVSASAMLASTGFAICQMIVLFPSAFSAENWSLAAFSLVVPLLIILRHHSNLKRLLRGEEARFQTAREEKSAQPNGVNTDQPKTTVSEKAPTR